MAAAASRLKHPLNRDEFVIVRKMDKVDWLDQPAKTEAAE